MSTRSLIFLLILCSLRHSAVTVLELGLWLVNISVSASENGRHRMCWGGALDQSLLWPMHNSSNKQRTLTSPLSIKVRQWMKKGMTKAELNLARQHTLFDQEDFRMSLQWDLWSHTVSFSVMQTVFCCVCRQHESSVCAEARWSSTEV